MKRDVGHQLSALVSGLVFGAGLVISGMTQPQKVLGFLDPLGRFDASLILVMMGAIAVHLVAYRIRSKRSGPLFSPKFLVPTRRDIDAKLLDSEAEGRMCANQHLVITGKELPDGANLRRVNALFVRPWRIAEIAEMSD